MNQILGWYYLHINGDLIYKRDLDGIQADIRESPFAKMLWPVDPSDRLQAWNILIEASAIGANPARIRELAEKWGCDDEDAKEYAARANVRLYKDGDQWCSTRNDFINIQESPAGFGQTALEALSGLCKSLGYKPSKTWGTSFLELVGA